MKTGVSYPFTEGVGHTAFYKWLCYMRATVKWVLMSEIQKITCEHDGNVDEKC